MTSLPAPSAALDRLIDRFRAGDRTGLARAISVVEDRREGFQRVLHHLLESGVQARRLGITGPPGAGKSTLLALLAGAFREAGEEVGVVAVDPTSPYSGGALLGDRIRMNDLALDPGIFIRSMATRGSLGGLATTTKEVIDLMDVFGFPRVLVETVGVGQTELEITGATDTVVVVLVPESGDGIQALKAGLMEIADIFVVNKSDRPGADRIVQEVGLAVHLREGVTLRDIPAHHGVDLSAVGTKKEPPKFERKEPEEMERWNIPVLKTVAQSGEGVPELLEAIDRHRRFLESSGELERRRKARAEVRVRDVVDRTLRVHTWASQERRDILEEGLRAIARGEATPYSVADEVVEDFNR